MCLVIYLGTDAPVPGFADVAEGEIGLDPAPWGERPAALAAKAVVAGVADRVADGWNCSCIFLDTALPWEAGDDPSGPETARRAAAYAGLRRIARAALAVDPAPLLFSAWADPPLGAPRLTRDLAPEDLLPARHLFDDGSGLNPPVLIRIHAGADT